MRSVRLPLLLLVAGILLILYLAYQLVLPAINTSPTTTNNTYIEGIAGAPRAINPLLCNINEADRDICSLAFAGLTKFNEYGEVVPNLATWIISGDGLTYTFKLDTNRRWHDGTAVSADDVVFTTKLLQAPDFPGRPDISALWQTVQITKLDNSSVAFRLREPYAPFLDFTTIGLLPQHVLSGTLPSALDKIPFNLQPIGNGPWRVTQVNTSGARVSSITLELASDSGDVALKLPKVGVKKIIFRYYANQDAVIEALKNGDVDGMSNLTPAIVKKVAEIQNVTTYSVKMARTVSLFINQRRDSGAIALSEKNVRQALMYALDRNRIISEVLEGRGVVADSMFIPDTWAFNPNVQKYSKNKERSIQLLRDAGYDLRAVAPSPIEVWQKDNEAIAFTLLTPDDPTRRAIAEAVATQWRDIGIRVEIQPVRNLQRDFLESRSYQVALVEMSLDGDPDPYAMWHPSQSTRGQNYTGYNNKQVGEWVEVARLTNDRARRLDYYLRFQQTLSEDLPVLPLYYPIYRYAISNQVTNIQLTTLLYSSDRLRNIHEWLIENYNFRRSAR
jgi:peptide/nickel transport system substrate-binding protein